MIGILNTDTGQEREIHPNLKMFRFPQWAPDGLTFVAQGQDAGSHQGIFQIDATTGDAKPIVLGQGQGALGQPRWSPDGKKVFYVRGTAAGDSFTVFERDLASGSDKQIAKTTGSTGVPVISPDGTRIVDAERSAGSTGLSILLWPVGGGERRELLRIQASHPSALHMTWTPDSSGVIVSAPAVGGFKGWLVAISGGEPRKFELSDAARFNFNPDGRPVAFVTFSNQKAEVWALENFLAIPKAQR